MATRRRWGYWVLGKCLANANREHWQAVLGTRALALTGCRRNEIEGLKKTEIDWTGSALRLGNTKTGKSIRPIGDAALAVLRDACERSNSQFVFPSITSIAKQHIGLTEALQGIAGEDLPGLTSHGLRHSFSSKAEIDTALVAAADRIARHIDDAMTGAGIAEGGSPQKGITHRRG
jgi:integrase